MKLDSHFVLSHLWGMTTFKDSSEHKRWNHRALSALITHSPLQTELWPLKMCTFSLAPSSGFKERKGWTRAVAIESGSVPEGGRWFSMENEPDIPSSVTCSNRGALPISWCCRTKADSEICPSARGLVLPAGISSSGVLLPGRTAGRFLGAGAYLNHFRLAGGEIGENNAGNL